MFLFALGIAAERWGVLVHAACVLSNHYHLVVTDPGACLPKFTQHLNSLVARALNASMNRSENFWASKPCSVVRLVAAEDVVDKVAYTLANPVAAGLVHTGREWPGIWLHPERIGTVPLELGRPKHFFSKTGDTPEVVRFQLTAPPCFASAHDFVEQVTAALARKEEHEREIGDREIPPVASLLNQKPTDRPVTFEPRRRLNPRIAARNESKRIEALRELKQFRREHRDTLAAWRSGRRDVVFPAGTYLMRVLYRVPCASAAA